MQGFIPIFLFVAMNLTLFAQTNKSPEKIKKSDAQESSALGIIGGLSGGHLYVSYLAIGAIADDFGCGNYDSTVVQLHVGTIQNLIVDASGNLQRTKNLPQFTADAVEYMQNMLDAYELLYNEATLLINFTKSRSQADSEKFQVARKKSREKIFRLLGIQ